MMNGTKLMRMEINSALAIVTSDCIIDNNKPMGETPCFHFPMKLTARGNRKVLSEGSRTNENDEGESWYNRNYGQGHDSTTGKRKRSTLGSTYLRRFEIKWKLSTISFKIGFFLTAFWILSALFLRLWDFSFHQIGEQQERFPSDSIPSNFAVVINTFRRPERLQVTVHHYAETCGRNYGVGQVFVVWADQETAPPPNGDFFFEDTALRGNTTATANRVPVEILKKKKDSLNARFEPIPQLQTTSVFMVDDDIRVDCYSLRTAFGAWQKHPNSMVGYYPRLSSPPISPSSTNRNELVYHTWPIVFWRQKLNIILTKASFLHSKYLESYTNDDLFPKEIKDHVDLHRNCEDIAMSMLVAHYSKFNKRNERPARPIYVEGRVVDVGLIGGLSTGTRHFATRSDCVNQLTDILRSKGWESPLEDEFDLGQSSWVKHAPGFWWQASPSNLLEWLGLANTFT